MRPFSTVWSVTYCIVLAISCWSSLLKAKDIDRVEPVGASSEQQVAQSSDGIDDEISLLSESATPGLEVAQPVFAATKSETRTESAPSTISIVQQQQIEMSGCRTVGECLGGVPGVYVIDNHITENIAMRGVWGGPDSWSRVVKLMIDGVPATFYNTGGALVGPSFIPIQSAEAIEVIRGPGSALYGANAFLGVINVRTLEPPPGYVFQLNGEFGTINDRGVGGGGLLTSVTLPGGKKSYILAAVEGADLVRSGLSVASSSPNRSLYAGNVSHGDVSTPLSIFTKGRWDTEKFGVIEARAIYQKMDVYAQWSEMSILSSVNRYVQSNTILALGHRLRLADGTVEVHSFGGYTRGETLPEEVIDTREFSSYTFRRDRFNEAFNAGVEGSLTLSPLKILDIKALLGVDYLHDRDMGDTIHKVMIKDQGELSAGDTTILNVGKEYLYQNVGVYLQSTVGIFSRLNITAGFRYDYNSQWGNTYNVRTGVVGYPLENLCLKLLYGNSYVPPAPTQLFSFPLRYEGGIVGNPDLKVQTAHTVEASASYHYGEHWSAQAALFSTWINDRIEFISKDLQETATNFSKSWTIGMEIDLEWKWNPLFTKAVFSWQRTTVDKPIFAPYWYNIAYGSGEGGNLLPNYPPWNGNLNVGFTYPKWFLQAWASFSFVGQRKSSIYNIKLRGQAYTLDPYTTLDLNVRTIGLKFFGPPTEFSLHVTNLIGTKYASGGSLGVDTPGLGRTILLKVKQNF